MTEQQRQDMNQWFMELQVQADEWFVQLSTNDRSKIGKVLRAIQTNAVIGQQSTCPPPVPDPDERKVIEPCEKCHSIPCQCEPPTADGGFAG